jgi:hypothetical protein
VCSISPSPYILCSNTNILTKLFGDSLDVNRRRTYYNLGIGGKGGLVENGNEIVSLLNGSITLPVSSYKKFTSFSACRSMVSTVGIDNWNMNMKNVE